MRGGTGAEGFAPVPDASRKATHFFRCFQNTIPGAKVTGADG